MEKLWIDMTQEERDQYDAEWNRQNFLKVKAREPNLTREAYEQRRIAGTAFVKSLLRGE